MFTLNPQIEMFSPFRIPFSVLLEEEKVVSPEVIAYMRSNNTKVAAKCTPCQCCACR